MLQLGIRGLGIARFKFNPISWFLKGEPGAWYDPSDLTTLFQDSAGTIPMSAVGTVADQPVGLMLDKSKGLALGAELVVNPDFTTDTWWSKDAGVTISGGTANWIATAATYQIYRTSFLTVGAYYEITFTITSITLGGLRANVGANLGTVRTVAGTYTERLTATSSATFGVYSSGASTTASVDNVSVKLVQGNHAFQGDSTSTPAKRPMLSARVNLLTKTEDFSDAVWGTPTSTVAAITPTATIAPDGTLTGAKLYCTTSSGMHYITQTVSANKPITLSVYAKAAEFSFLGLGSIQYGGLVASFNLSDGTYDKTVLGGSLLDASMVPAGNGWYKCSVMIGNNILNYISINVLNAINNLGFTDLTSSGIYIWHPDLRPTNAGALLPAYQRVNTASDYDTAGFPLYLKCNGTSSAMSTNSIDYTTTNTTKLTIVAGVRSEAGGLKTIVESSEGVGISVGAYGFGQGYITGVSGIGYTANGPTEYGSETPALAVPYINVPTLLLDVQATPLANRGKIRINGIAQALPSTYGSAASTGSIANYKLYLFSRAGSTTTVYNGNFYGAIIRGAASDTASVTQTENYMATKTGITF